MSSAGARCVCRRASTFWYHSQHSAVLSLKNPILGQNLNLGWTGLRLINFDGLPIDRRERAVRFAAASFSFASAGFGMLWSLTDEESLTWHDHKTFPTPLATSRRKIN